ncbi:MAG TPA: Wzz/FepE/Etk N-terminal domain-containing protein [Ktedonobacteraceae bacterium]|nr:Wzz/FepE/Etk N-terminal domain-containing protein [Ktedonobacteraceae bacterium]
MQLHDMLWHYGWVIRRWFRLILLGTAGCAVATFAISSMLPPVYQASALIKVHASVASSSGDVFSDQALAVSYSLLITSPDVLQATAQRLPGLTVNRLQNAVSDSPLDSTQLIEVRSQANDPQQAANIANTVVNVFIQLQIAKEGNQLQAMLAELSMNMIAAKTDLDSAQSKLLALQNAHTPEDRLAYQRSLVDTYEANYNTLLTNYRQLQDQQLHISDILTVAQAAIPPEKPVSPQILLNTIIAMLLGMLLMVIFALLLDWADTSIKTTDDVSQLAALEPLGGIPLSSEAAAATVSDILLVRDPAVDEAFAAAWTSFEALNRGQRLIMVTGMRSGSGASTVAARLAVLLAQTGKRILLVDANLRRPSQHEIFRFPNSRGLINCPGDVYMLQEQTAALLPLWLNQWKAPIPNLWILPTGPAAGHTAALLRMPELRHLLKWLLLQPTTISNRQVPHLIDMIIFDASPIGEGSEAILLAPITDATVLVVEAGKAQRELLHTVRTALQKVGSPVLGVVVNRQQAKYRSYFYVDRIDRRYANLHDDITATDELMKLSSELPIISHEEQQTQAVSSLAEMPSTPWAPLTLIDTDVHNVPETPPFNLRPLGSLHIRLPSLPFDAPPRTSNLGQYGKEDRNHGV